MHMHHLNHIVSTATYVWATRDGYTFPGAAMTSGFDMADWEEKHDLWNAQNTRLTPVKTSSGTKDNVASSSAVVR